MTPEFDRCTALTKGAHEGAFRGEISRDYWVQSGPNGGYLGAIMLRGATHCVPEPERIPRALHLRFLAAPAEGEFELSAEVLRRGRSMTSVAVTMRQAQRVLLTASACFSQPFSELSFADVPMPEARPLLESTPVPKLIPLNHRYDMWHAIGEPLRSGERALTGGWIRFADPRPFDALALAALWDGWPPAVFARAMQQRFRGAVPTVEASVYFRRAMPLPELTPDRHVLLRLESTMAHEGFVEESGEIWSPDGLLLAQSRQLALLV